ncbi:hypothetical protein Bca52824_023862 [Brassica carinata]|uniref:Uncharacterized protein n=1 Tax=Brassica carinata TaxID=52824 RepID=A0A8X7VJ46_BRACI|nr:hypothetical protein Bca52824_023862 [Brassica carinata]
MSPFEHCEVFVLVNGYEVYKKEFNHLSKPPPSCSAPPQPSVSHSQAQSENAHSSIEVQPQPSSIHSQAQSETSFVFSSYRRDSSLQWSSCSESAVAVVGVFIASSCRKSSRR